MGGSLKFRLKDLPRKIFIVLRSQSIKITSLRTIFIDFDFCLLIISVYNHTWNFTDVVFERVADLNYDKLVAYKPDQYKPPEDFKPGLKEKKNNIYILKIF